MEQLEQLEQLDQLDQLERGESANSFATWGDRSDHLPSATFLGHLNPVIREGGS